jgi:pimeloyl-ACP methyl ester carboxylesterase
MKSLTIALAVLTITSPLFAIPASALTPPVVLVHGANFSGKSWGLVQKDLARLGVTSYAPDLYTAKEQPNLRQVAARLCEAIRKLNQPAVLVGHSQGGAVITEAASLCVRSVRSLIYVSAVIPQPGEGVFDALSAVDNRHYEACGALDPETNTYRLKGEAECRRVFFPDLLGFQAGPYYATMVPEPASIGSSQADYSTTTISSLPKTYVFTQDDLIISKATQVKITQKARLTRQLTLQSSHTPFFRLHSQLAGFIAQSL